MGCPRTGPFSLFGISQLSAAVVDQLTLHALHEQIVQARTPAGLAQLGHGVHQQQRHWQSSGGQGVRGGLGITDRDGMV